MLMMVDGGARARYPGGVRGVRGGGVRGGERVGREEGR